MARHTVLALTLALAFAATVAHGQVLRRGPDETAMRFAERVLSIRGDDDDHHALEAKWNGAAFIFADFARGQEGKDAERPLVAFARTPDGGYRRIEVTIGEEEGGRPDVAAIGFANADRDRADELIVILTWFVRHADVSGTLYSVRVFDDAKPGQTRLRPLAAVNKHFDVHTCDCEWSDRKPERYPFKTIAKVKAELKRMNR